MKVCRVCQLELPVTAFSPSRLHRDGYLPICRHCRNEDNRAKRRTNRTRYIYALVDPRTERVRYIGCTANVHVRLKGHIADAKSAPYINPIKAHWINELLSEHLLPQVVILEVTTVQEAQQRERTLIYQYKISDSTLLNAQVIYPFTK